MPRYDALADASNIVMTDPKSYAGVPSNFGSSANSVGVVPTTSELASMGTTLPGSVDPAEAGVVEPSSDIVDTKTSVDSALEGGWSLSDYMKNNPGMDYESIMNEAARHSDEFAEKYLDYLVEKGELDRANEYTAQREDTAYQRLVEDLKKAGLNPAMMYGSSASTSASGSQGYVKMVEGANTRGVGNYTKLKNLILAYMSYELQKGLGIADKVIDGVDALANIVKAVVPFAAFIG